MIGYTMILGISNGIYNLYIYIYTNQHYINNMIHYLYVMV